MPDMAACGDFHTVAWCRSVAKLGVTRSASCGTVRKVQVLIRSHGRLAETWSLRLCHKACLKNVDICYFCERSCLRGRGTVLSLPGHQTCNPASSKMAARFSVCCCTMQRRSNERLHCRRTCNTVAASRCNCSTFHQKESCSRGEAVAFGDNRYGQCEAMERRTSRFFQ